MHHKTTRLKRSEAASRRPGQRKATRFDGRRLLRSAWRSAAAAGSTAIPSVLAEN